MSGGVVRVLLSSLLTTTTLHRLMADTTATGANNSIETSNATNTANGQVETSKAERHVWLMKCPPVVSRSLHQNHRRQQQQQRHQHHHDDAASLSDGPIAKVVVAVDPLLPNDNFSSTQVLLHFDFFFNYISGKICVACKGKFQFLMGLQGLGAMCGPCLLGISA